MTLGVLKATSDRKVRSAANQSNCFGLLPGHEGTCPGATVGPGGCSHIKEGRKSKVCYVDNLVKVYKGVYGVLAHNTFIMKNATKEERQAILEVEFQRYVDTETKRAAKAGEKPWMAYRLHWSGDFFDMAYAEAAAAAMLKFPQLKFWVYTRSFSDEQLNVVSTLAKVPNLALYLSLDPVNMVAGLDTYYTWLADPKGFDNVQICYLSPGKVNDFPEQWYAARAKTQKGDLWTEKPIELSTCPVDIGKLPLESGCFKCQKCLGLRRSLAPIWFCP